MQTCLVERGYPVRLEAAPATLLSANGALAVRYHDRALELEASSVQLSAATAYAYRLDRPADWTTTEADGGAVEIHKLRPDDVFTPADINADLAHIGATNVRFGDGGHGGHGGGAFADDLAADAGDDAKWVRRESESERTALTADEQSGATSRGFDEIFAWMQESLRKPAP